MSGPSPPFVSWTLIPSLRAPLWCGPQKAAPLPQLVPFHPEDTRGQLAARMGREPTSELPPRIRFPGYFPSFHKAWVTNFSPLEYQPPCNKSTGLKYVLNCLLDKATFLAGKQSGNDSPMSQPPRLGPRNLCCRRLPVTLLLAGGTVSPPQSRFGDILGI